MKIVLITETLHAGGAETFVIRLANGLAVHHDVVLINIYPHLSKQELLNQVSTNVTLVNLCLSFRFLLSKVDGLFYRCKIDFSFIELLIKSNLFKLITKFKPSVVHTHLFKPDYYVSVIRKNLDIQFNHVTTNHGDYLLFETKKPVRLLNYDKKLNQTLQSINKMVVISDDQMKWANKRKQHYEYQVSEILNGYSFTNLSPTKKTTLSLNDTDFVYGMVGRGIKEKGWHNLIRAFNRLNINNKKLLLVGQGPEIDILKEIYKHDDRIIFIGYAALPVEYIKLFDVAIFASYAPGESLPTVIIEYLICNKPLIATEIGALKKMLHTSDNAIAGLLINHSSEEELENELEKKMDLLYKDSQLRMHLTELTKNAFLKFDMQRCVDSYLNIYGQNGK